MRAMLTRHLDLEALRQSPIEIIISAVHLATGRLHLYNQDVIEIDHLMASSAMPILFPWQPSGENLLGWGRNGEFTPFRCPGKEDRGDYRGLAVAGRASPLPPPHNLREGLERLFEHFLIGSCQTTMPVFNGQPVHACDPPWRPAMPQPKKHRESL
jgi:NTE family protein